MLVPVTLIENVADCSVLPAGMLLKSHLRSAASSGLPFTTKFADVPKLVVLLLPSIYVSAVAVNVAVTGFTTMWT